jgi:hypothetical protein
MQKLIVSAIVGALLGVIGAKYLFVGSGISLLPWALVGLIVGYYCLDRRRAAYNGAVYGFFLTFSFMISGYSGSEPLLTRIPFFILLGLAGALCGIFLSLPGYWLKSIVRHKAE